MTDQEFIYACADDGVVLSVSSSPDKFMLLFMSVWLSLKRNGESGNGNGERGMGMGNLLKWGISKRGNY